MRDVYNLIHAFADGIEFAREDAPCCGCCTI
jgi:hypothetical protein